MSLAATLLSSARRYRGVSGRALARQTASSQAGLVGVENGSADATIERLDRILRALDYQVVALPTRLGTASDAEGKNRIIIIPGANNSTDPAVAETAVREFAPAIVVGELEIPQHVTLAAFRAARAAGITTLLNPAPAAELDPDLLAATDWLAPNETEFATIFGGEPRGDGAVARIKAAAAKSGAKLVVTLGSAGAVIAIPGEELINIAAPEAKVIDTTGAGDAFLGAFAFGLASGLTPVEAAKLSVACASASVERLGTQSSYLSREDAAALAAPYLAKRSS